MKASWLMKLICAGLFSLLVIFGLIHDNTPAIAQQSIDKIESTLLERFAAEGRSDFIVVFTQQADLSAAYSMDWNARGDYVYDTLSQVAESSQLNARQILDSYGLQHLTFIAGNELYVWAGDLTQASELSTLEEVLFIRAPRTYTLSPFREANLFANVNWAADLLAGNLLTTVNNAPEAITDWGIIDTKANQFWSAYGVKGDGIVVANIDTGVQWNHPALDQSYKCPGNPTSSVCWNDPTGVCAGNVCDNIGHGTHVMGTMVGDDDPALTYIVGMAPNAQWIACKGCQSNSCDDLYLNSCADWILAPGGNASNRPHIVNNSWGAAPDGDPWYQAKVNAWRAAGIFPAFSAGNAGSACDTLSDPGSYQESFASAAHDTTRAIASFSSRGPSAFGHDPYTKPNISAPGVDICSSVPGNAWNCTADGTSMASPHNAGAVALLWSCNPSLVGQVNTTIQLLQDSADPAPAGTCGAPPDGQGNYTYGYGYLNVLDAGATGCAAAGDTWTQIPLPAGCPDWIRFDGEYYPNTQRIYFLGGRGGDGSVTYGDIYSFNPVTTSCQNTGADLTTPISNYTLGLVNNGSAQLLCTFGGRDSAGSYINAVQCYNPVTNLVTTPTTLPGELGLFIPGGVEVINNKVYVFGGFRNTVVPYHTAQTWEWNPVSNTWTQKGNLNLARGYINTAVVDGKIYAFGGDVYNGATLVADIKSEVFDPASGIWSDSPVADLPAAMGEGRAFGFDSYSTWEIRGKVILVGGGQFPNETVEVFAYDVDLNTYDYSFPDLNVARRNQAGFFMSGNPGAMWVFGGRSVVDIPPYAPPEYYPLNLLSTGRILMPLVLRP